MKKSTKVFKLNLDVNGGDALISYASDFSYGESFTLSVPKRAGHTFVGWYLNEDGKGKRYTDNLGNGLLRWNVAENTTLYAGWIKNNKVISNKNELQKMTLSGDYYLANDIDLEGMEWVPFGSGASPFKGSFEGDGHRIFNFKIENGFERTGFFGCNRGNISNLGLELFTINIKFSRPLSVGGLAGENLGSITNCYALGNIISSCTRNISAGGLVGENCGGTITNSYSTGHIDAVSKSSFHNVYSGGLAGHNYEDGQIINCCATGDVIAQSKSSFNSAYAGGLAGYNVRGNVKNSYATGNIRSTYCAGGLAGYNFEGCSIADSYATGDVNSVSQSIAYAGGIVGYNCEGGRIAACYATGNMECVAKSHAYVGGIAGFSEGGTITNVYRYRGQTFSRKEYLAALDLQNSFDTFTTASNEIGIPTTLKNLKSEEWSKANMWGFNVELWYFASKTFPTLRENYEEIQNSVIEISDVEVFKQINYSSRKFVLTADINLGGVEWKPLRFYGSLDGNGHRVFNFRIMTGGAYLGLFGYNGGSITNLRVENYLINANFEGNIYAGGLVGYNGKGTISNCSTKGAISAIGTGVSSVVYCGGLIGYNYENGTISDSFSTEDVRCTSQGVAYAGGLLGYNFAGGAITRCYSTAAILSSYCAGGLVGDNCGNITVCYASGDITSATARYTYAGGLSGSNSGTVRNCYALGDVKSSSTNISSAGGLVGFNYAGGAIVGSFATGYVSNISSSAYAGGLVGYNYEGGTVSRSFAAGSVSSARIPTSSYGEILAGGLVGENSNGTIDKSYRNGVQSFFRKVGLTRYKDATNELGDTTTLKNLQSEDFLAVNIGLGKFQSLEHVVRHKNNVWVFENGLYPSFYWEIPVQAEEA